MKWSITLGRIAGIKLAIHWTFIILLGVIFITQIISGLGLTGAILGIIYLLTVFTCIVLHELGHALTAKQFNIDTKNIILLPIGGLALMERMPEKPGQEILIAIAGPLVNVVIACGLYFYLIITGGISSIEELKILLENEASMITKEYFLFNLIVVNSFISLFNLIPAFPMDGGRILRATLCYIYKRTKATIIAARIGQFFAILLIFTGFYANFLLSFIGIFIFLSARLESNYEVSKSLLSNNKVKDVFKKNYESLSPFNNLEEVVNRITNGQLKEFLVIDNNNIIKGVISSEDAINGLAKYGKNTFVTNIMEKNFFSFEPETKLIDVYEKMMRNKSQFGLVYNNNHLIGIVTREDIDNLILVKKALNN
jgi:Zn-dependent protease/predicted transcriptional regulator